MKRIELQIADHDWVGLRRAARRAGKTLGQFIVQAALDKTAQGTWDARPSC